MAFNYKKNAQPILWEDALKLIKNYEEDNNGQRTIPTDDNSEVNYLSIEFDKPHMSELVNTMDIESDRVFFMIGYRDTPILPITRSGFTIIAMGLDAQNKLMVEPDDFFWDPLLPDGGNSHANITLPEVKLLTMHYREFHPVPTEFGGRTILKGFSFPMSELESITTDPKATSVELILAYHEISGSDNEIGYTLIMIGKDSHGERIISDNKVFDYCDPCPKKCPKNIDFQYFI